MTCLRIPEGRMALAAYYRTAAVQIVREGLNYVRTELRSQIVSGQVNPLAVQADSEQDGYSPTRIDAVMDRLIEQRVRQLSPGATYISEENRKTVSPDPGDIYAIADPLDGTTNAFTMFGAYSVVLYFDRFTGNEFDHLGGAIASSDGSIVSWQNFRNGEGEVWIDWPENFDWPTTDATAETDTIQPATQIPRPPLGIQVARKRRAGGSWAGRPQAEIHHGLSTRMAAVSYSTGRRADLDDHFDFKPRADDGESRLYVSSFAGNPVIAPLLVGQLGSVVETRAVKLHDAAFLIPLVLAGGLVVDFTDTEINVLRCFQQHDGADPLARRIGPFIAAADDTVLETVLRRLRRK
ncbi:hypothetical protein ABZ671_16235 [Micromonospora sp. NPDC006766]|uniref:hypothetical protein n=1 Tax=Micromonospora sp. NPDC006766 TaxID=3154778 RepID=UPI0033C69BAA